jgi:hypothetical protein
VLIDAVETGAGRDDPLVLDLGSGPAAQPPAEQHDHGALSIACMHRFT